MFAAIHSGLLDLQLDILAEFTSQGVLAMCFDYRSCRVAALVMTTMVIFLIGCQPGARTSSSASTSSDVSSSNELRATSSTASKDTVADEAANAIIKEKPSVIDKSTSLKESSKFNALNKDEQRVILHKGTEMAWTGEYTDWKLKGTFICRRCNAPLYKTDAKFDSHCGWPSFDDEIEGSVARNVDADGYRIEIVCKNCGGHLGHVFEGEGFTPKDTRHCVNSISIRFVAEGDPLPETIKPD